jgi:hypothetical protein
MDVVRGVAEGRMTWMMVPTSSLVVISRSGLSTRPELLLQYLADYIIASTTTGRLSMIEIVEPPIKSS